MKHAICLLLAATLPHLQANPLAPLTSCPTDTATTIVKQHLLLDNVSLPQLTALGYKPLIADSLNGWSIHNDKPEVTFTLKDGVISGKGEDLKGNSFLYTTAEYDNYLLYFEFRFDHRKGNSGLMYHSKYNAANKFAGIQYEMDPGDKMMGAINRQWTGLLYAENLGGWHYPNRDGAGGKEKATQETMLKLSKEGTQSLNPTGWNAGFIRIRGNEIQTWLNGQLRTDYTWKGPDFPGKGSIALQIHGGKSCAVSWRNIYILPIGSENNQSK
jgi:hypothetical protein